MGKMANDRPHPIIDAEDIEFRWRRDAPLVLGIDALRIEAGECVFIAGPSGSGKSTLLSLLSGVTVPSAGSIRTLGRSLGALSGVQRDHFRANHIGYIFQMFNLLPYLSVVENVTLPCRFSRRRREVALQRSRTLDDEALRLLGHLDLSDPELLHRAVSSLSVGQQQRVAAARALMGSPEILIADEPTSSLDTARRQAFIELLFDECRANNTTLVFVSHDETLRASFDRVIELASINRVSADSARAD